MTLLKICGMLAAGEYLASLVPNVADVWPMTAALAVLTALFGYGLAVRGWQLVLVFFVGATLYFAASLEDEQLYREKPWMRGRAERIQRHAASASGWSRVTRKSFSRRIGIGVDGGQETVALSRAILLGERRRLSPQMKRLFVESGTMHVFAISGLHVMAIAEVLAFVLSLALVPRRLVGLAAVPLLWCYVYLIGLSPSAVRAAIMATFSCLAPLFWRKPDGLRSWTLTFLVVHLACPRMIVNVGNVLSFAVMLAIVLVGDCVRNLAQWKRTLLVTMAAWAVGVPISAHVFGRVTPGGMLANLVLLAVARLTVLTGALGVLTSYVSETVAAHLNNLSALAVRTMVFVAEVVTRLPGANFETGRWLLPTCVIWYAAFAAGVYVLYKGVERRQRV